jgi:hypothetical protein
MGVFEKRKISSEIVATNIYENIEPSFEKHRIELFLRKDIVMIYLKASCPGCDFEPCLKSSMLTL